MAPILYMQKLSPPVRSVQLTAKALGLRLETKNLDLFKAEHITEVFMQMNPQHTIPTLDDNGVIIWDSHAINTYLVDKYGKDDTLYPKDLYKRAIVNQRLHFDTGVLFPWLRYAVVRVQLKGHSDLTEDQRDFIEEGYNHLENFLSGNLWVTGDTLTIADFSLLTTTNTLNVIVPVDQQRFPNVCRWLQQAENTLPYYKEVNQEGIEDFKEIVKPILQSVLSKL